MSPFPSLAEQLAAVRAEAAFAASFAASPAIGRGERLRSANRHRDALLAAVATLEALIGVKGQTPEAVDG